MSMLLPFGEVWLSQKCIQPPYKASLSKFGRESLKKQVENCSSSISSSSSTYPINGLIPFQTSLEDKSTGKAPQDKSKMNDLLIYQTCLTFQATLAGPAKSLRCVRITFITVAAFDHPVAHLSSAIKRWEPCWGEREQLSLAKGYSRTLWNALSLLLIRIKTVELFNQTLDCVSWETNLSGSLQASPAKLVGREWCRAFL